MRIGVQWLAHLCGTYLAQPVLFRSHSRSIFFDPISSPTILKHEVMGAQLTTPIDGGSFLAGYIFRGREIHVSLSGHLGYQ